MSSTSEPRILNVAGLRLPLRGTVVVLVTTFVLLIDYYQDRDRDLELTGRSLVRCAPSGCSAG